MADNLWLGLTLQTTAALRPTTPTSDAGFVLHYATDTEAVSLWNGTAWLPVLTGGGGGVVTASLPTPSTALKGARAWTTDGAATPVFGAVATGSGTLFLPVFCDGTNWRNG